MKFFRAVLEKHAPLQEKKVEMVKKSSIRNFLFNCAAFNWALTANAKICKIPGFFLSWNFLMYNSNKGLKPITACVILRRKKTYGTVIKQINCRFIGAMFVCLLFFFCNLCARADSHQHECARKKSCVQPP